MPAVTLTGFRPAPLMSSNDRNHWRVEHERRKEWQAAAFWIAKQNKVQPLKVFPVEVTCTFTRVRKGRIDPHNYFPTVKHLIDGLTMAGVWPDDDSTHVHTREPIFIAGDGRKFSIEIEWEE